MPHNDVVYVLQVEPDHIRAPPMDDIYLYAALIAKALLQVHDAVMPQSHRPSKSVGTGNWQEDTGICSIGKPLLVPLAEKSQNYACEPLSS